MKLGKISERVLEVIERERAFGMAGELDALPGGEVGEDLLFCFLELLFKLLDLFFKAHPQSCLFAQLVEPGLDFKNRLLEIEQIFHAVAILSFLFRGRNAEFSTLKEPDFSGSVMMRLIRPHRGAQKGSEANYFDAVRAPLRA
jgi:hypothetical protein